ncbi:hypothetical protein ScalyP_jg2651, partial [Parmales sp. scaly parma]
RSVTMGGFGVNKASTHTAGGGSRFPAVRGVGGQGKSRTVGGSGFRAAREKAKRKAW